MKMPIIFIGHGSPMNAIETNEFTEKWIEVAKKLPKPRGILAISAHWYTRGTWITTLEEPKTIYDMHGFPKELYEINYNAKTEKKFIEKIIEVSNGEIKEDNSWGYDHGVWSILHKIYPNRDIPVVEMSIDGTKTPEEHFELGKKLKSLREEGYLIFSSGNIVHNLALVDFYNEEGYDWAKEFDEEIKNAIIEKDFEKVLNYKKIKNKNKAFTSDEHFLPIIYLLGAWENTDEISVFNDKVVMGSLSMTSYLFE